MKPRIAATQFGSITLGGTVYDRDVMIGTDGKVRRRKKKLSKAIYGTSHIISLDEAEHIYRHGQGADRLIIGGGQYGRVELSPEAADYFASKHCQVVLRPTPEAIAMWNDVNGDVIGLFHVTC